MGCAHGHNGPGWRRARLPAHLRGAQGGGGWHGGAWPGCCVLCWAVPGRLQPAGMGPELLPLGRLRLGSPGRNNIIVLRCASGAIHGAHPAGARIRSKGGERGANCVAERAGGEPAAGDWVRGRVCQGLPLTGPQQCAHDCISVEAGKCYTPPRPPTSESHPRRKGISNTCTGCSRTHPSNVHPDPITPRCPSPGIIDGIPPHFLTNTSLSCLSTTRALLICAAGAMHLQVQPAWSHHLCR